MTSKYDMEARLVKIETTLDYIKEEQDRNKDDHTEIKKMIKDFVDGADKKYANKTAEYITYGLVAIIVTAVLYALLNGLIIGG